MRSRRITPFAVPVVLVVAIATLVVSAGPAISGP
jgi:hypothetical protein